jgi:hypothetical protein
VFAKTFLKEEEMKGHKAFWALVVAGAVASLPLRQAYAGDKYQSSLVQETGQLDPSKQATTTLTKSGKIKIAPSKKKGDGGLTFQLIAKGINCGAKCNNNVIDVGVRALATDVPNAVGLLFNIVGGKPQFANGKNKTGTGSLFGPLASAVFNQSLGIGFVSLREPASDPTACQTVPLLDGNKCNDGNIYAVAGFVVPEDVSQKCTTDDDCPSITLECSSTSSYCVLQTCAADGDCRSGHCNINQATCCDPASAGGCP